MQSVGNGYIQAYLPIIEKRKDTVFGERENGSRNTAAADTLSSTLFMIGALFLVSVRGWPN